MHNSNNTQKLTHSLSPVQFSLSKQKKKKKYTLTIAWYSVAEWNDKRSKQIDSLIRVVTVSYKQWHVCSLLTCYTTSSMSPSVSFMEEEKKFIKKKTKKKSTQYNLNHFRFFFFRRRLFPLYDFWAHWNFALFFEKSEVLFCIRAIWLIIFLMSYEKKKKMKPCYVLLLWILYICVVQWIAEICMRPSSLRDRNGFSHLIQIW